MRSLLLLAIGFSILFTWSQVTVEACGPGRPGGRRSRLRRYPPLVQRQYIPNVSENTLGASGRPEGPIRRRDKRFKELVQNWNPDIEFRDDERTGADRMMSQRLKEKLSTLAISVMNLWPNVKLRVIEGWDEDNRHSLNSLHYEGRAVDITTSDRDKSKYGMLARLAVEAGFDWVHYESRSHVHCSVKSEKADTIRNNGCFDAASLVDTPAGQVEMSQLQENDLVLTMNPQSGRLKYSPIIMWLDKDERGAELYVELKTESNRLIRLTSSHLLFVADESVDLTQVATAATSSLPTTKFVSMANTRLDGVQAGSGNNNHYYYYDTATGTNESGKTTKSPNANKTTTTTTTSDFIVSRELLSAKARNSSDQQQQVPPTLDELVYTTYARNVIVGQYLLIDPSTEGTPARSASKTQPVKRNSTSGEKVAPIDDRYSKFTYEMQTLEKELDNTPLSRLVFKHKDYKQNVQQPELSSQQRISEGTHRSPISPPPGPRSSRVKFDKIVSVNYVTRKGIYAPLTREGNIVVNSVVASCYAVFSDHELAHLSFAPIRWASYLNEWIFGLVPETPLSERIIDSATTKTRQEDNLIPIDNNRNDNIYIKPQTIIASDAARDNNLFVQQQQTASTTRKIHWYPTMLYCIAKFILPSGYLY